MLSAMRMLSRPLGNGKPGTLLNSLAHASKVMTTDGGMRAALIMPSIQAMRLQPVENQMIKVPFGSFAFELSNNKTTT